MGWSACAFHQPQGWLCRKGSVVIHLRTQIHNIASIQCNITRNTCDNNDRIDFQWLCALLFLENFFSSIQCSLLNQCTYSAILNVRRAHVTDN